jgi:hypothetical protein
MSAEPVRRLCGAKTRGERGGRPCRGLAMGNGRCRMHGGKSGGPTGSRNGAYRHGRYTQKTKQLGAWARKLARDADVMTATVMHKHGLKPPAAIRRRRHVRKAIAAAKAKEGAT